jgi:hypothetical protein
MSTIASNFLLEVLSTLIFMLPKSKPTCIKWTKPCILAMLLVQTNHVVTPKQKSHNGPCKVPFSLQWPSMAHLLDPLIDRCPHTLELKLSLGHLLAKDSIFVDIRGDLSAFL